MTIFWRDLVTKNPRITVVATREDSNGTIVAVGDEALLQERRVGDRVESLEGGFVTAGFWDSHIHLLDFARNFSRVAFSDQDDFSHVLAKVSRQARLLSSPDEWLIGAGWNLEALGRRPDLAALDVATGTHPTLLMSLDYHSVWVNSHAVDQLELSVDDRALALRAGVLRERAAFAAQEQAEAHSPVNLDQAVRELNGLGLVGATVIEPPAGFSILQQYQSRSRTLRLGLLLRESAAEALVQAGIRGGFGDDFLRIRGIKLFADGALGSHTAWTLAPYEGDPENYGTSLMDVGLLNRWVARLFNQGLGVAVHAIGDRAVQQVAGALLSAWGNQIGGRIEHAQLMSDDTLNALAGKQVALSMQPIHLLVDRSIADRHWGLRSREAFRLRNIMDAGIPLTFGSDAPIASPDPTLGLWAAVHRGQPGESPWYSEQRLSPDEAIWCYTRGTALVDDRPSGLIEPGYWGDFTVWREDPRIGLTVGERDRLAVTGTIVAGNRVD